MRNFGPFVINHSTPMSKWLKKSKCLGFLCGFPLLKMLEMSKTTRISNTFWGIHIFKQLKYLKIFENNLKFSRFSEVSSDSVFQPREYCRSLGVSNLVVILNCQPITMMTLNTIWISTCFWNDQHTWPSVAVLSSFCVLTDILSKGFILRCYDTLK